MCYVLQTFYEGLRAAPNGRNTSASAVTRALCCRRPRRGRLWQKELLAESCRKVARHETLVVTPRDRGELISCTIIARKLLDHCRSIAPEAENRPNLEQNWLMLANKFLSLANVGRILAMNGHHSSIWAGRCWPTSATNWPKSGSVDRCWPAFAKVWPKSAIFDRALSQIWHIDSKLDESVPSWPKVANDKKRLPNAAKRRPKSAKCARI